MFCFQLSTWRTKWRSRLGEGTMRQRRLSVLITPHFLGLRDRLSDRMWVGHVDDGEFGFVSGGGNLDRPYPEDAIDEALRDTYGADVSERHRGAVLAQDAPLIHEFAVGDGERSGTRLDVPIQQDDDADAKGEKAHTGVCCRWSAG